MPPKRKSKAGNGSVSATVKRAKSETKRESVAMAAALTAENLQVLESDWSYAGKITSKGVSPLMMLSGNWRTGSPKIAGFDLDSTLIVPKSGRKFGTGPSDWKLMTKVKEKLQSIHQEGFKVIICTNQRGIEKGYSTPQDFQKKLNCIISELGIPVEVYAATGENHYRKPYTLMWDYMIEHHNNNIEPDLDASYYVGDAAGRPKDWAPGKKRDFSCSDRMFAANVGIKFFTPEEYFLEDKAVPFDWRVYNPRKILQEAEQITDVSYQSKEKEVVLMVGPPASGKSSFSKRYLVPHGYICVNRDTLLTPAKCLAATKSAIKEGKSVVVDNTNPSKANRAQYIVEAKKAGYKVRCFIVTTPLDLAHHLNYVRQVQTEGKVRRVPKVAYNMYKKNYEEPNTNEGFDEICEIPFIPKFDSERNKELFLQWTQD